MDPELATPPAADYIPQKCNNQALALQPISPKKQVFQRARGIVNSIVGTFQGFKEASSPNASGRKFSLPFAEYLKQKKIFVLSSSQESDEEEGFETVTDADKPYIHCMMSGAVIAIPYAFKQVGIPIGVTLIITFAFLIDYCTLLLIQNSMLAQKDTYQGIVKEAFGTIFYMIVCSVQVLFYVSTMSLYHAILGDILPKLTKRMMLITKMEQIDFGRRFPIIMVALLVLIPLSLCRNIRRISKMSLISLFCVTLLITFSLIRLTTIGHHVPYTHSPFRFSNMNVFQAIGVVVFVFLSHHSSYLFNGSIQESASSRFNSTTYMSISYSLLCTLTLGIVGFITFKGLVQGDFLENYCEEDDVANIIRFLIAILVITLYPLECHGARDIIYNTFLIQQNRTLLRHIAITLFLVTFACSIAMFVDCISLILEISGLLIAVPLGKFLSSSNVLQKATLQIT
eukprot:Seg503.11 transcript_id=Seg503.11/GoldUCD/mRNA.D3Y31 product="putative sodium-coupled neutral amino acid transporter 11" protein_id=Seg503.11/GoldUCD/D3Y31